jgi:thioester reductase-like protein
VRGALAYHRRAITEAEVQELVCGYLSLDSRDVDLSRSLASYGVDSLSALELVALLEDACGRSLPEWLIAEHPTLGDLVAALCSDEAAPADSEIAIMRADCQLPADINPPATSARDGMRHVLLTGATGFLGAALLRALLEGPHTRVTCLIRATPGDGRRRLREALALYANQNEIVESRIDIVEGDLACEGLGLTEAQYRHLSVSIDTIHHAAADVNWVSPYSALRAVNVLGTRELLRLACTSRTKSFHFVSSLSVCYAIGGPALVDEAVDMLPFLERMPLGYAQSKCVSESLVRHAAARGLPTRIYRPALLAGDTRNGRSNLDDLVARLLKGCIEMGAAPDLDWPFDAIPVDYVAPAIAHLGSLDATVGKTIHLAHPRPRHWRECVLWANTLGYRMGLETFPRWCQRLTRESASPAHPLHGLRAFFLRPLGGRTVAEHYEARWRSEVSDAASRLMLQEVSRVEPPRMDADLLDRYVGDYVARGFLPARSIGARSTAPIVDAALIEPILKRHYGDDALQVRDARLVSDGSGGSILGELVSSRRGRGVGLFHYDLALSGACPSTLGVVVKAKASDDDAIEAAEMTASVCDRELGRLVTRFRESLGLRRSHLRELALYESVDRRIGTHMPRCYGTWRRPEDRSWGLVLERLDEMLLIDASDSTECWTPAFLAAAIDGLSEIHSVWLGRASELEVQPWIGPVVTAATMQRMTPLWIALAAHAAPRFEGAAGTALVRRHRELAQTVGRWWHVLDSGPRTLIHNDFNSRNIGIRRTPEGPRLVAYDWELAAIGAPQRDLAELLCFVLPPTVGAATVRQLVERHRRRLQRRSGVRLPSRQWHAGFACALADVLINRLSFYALIDRVTPQPYLTRVLHTWLRLDEIARGCVIAAKDAIAAARADEAVSHDFASDDAMRTV